MTPWQAFENTCSGNGVVVCTADAQATRAQTKTGTPGKRERPHQDWSGRPVGGDGHIKGPTVPGRPDYPSSPNEL